jgi:hypothetical protein
MYIYARMGSFALQRVLPKTLNGLKTPRLGGVVGHHDPRAAPIDVRDLAMHAVASSPGARHGFSESLSS